MKHVFGWLVLVMLVSLTEPCFGQDPLAEYKIRGLKGIHTLSVVVRPNTPLAVASPKEWGGMVEVGLHRRVPELTVSDTTNAPVWLELSVITTDACGLIEISVYRWTKLLDSGDDIFSKVWWDSRVVCGGVSKTSLQKSLDALLTSFAADYLRAK